ncbi:hypothetical protein BDZ94DRAFT_1301317 [Collybia nuda]|uniref:Uncharacterized protein n=1 Tax=Collybia nuda TaxID=64659 RepID=A0A9P6CEP9_9AGAR|nr:hypothetical protein BDZ94DRAFT_1301317 [Collybia nuda]
MCNTVVRWDASGRFSRGRLPGEYLSDEPYPPQAGEQSHPVSGDILSIPFLDDGVSYSVQITRKLPGYLKGVGPTDFTHLLFGPWEVGRYRTCFIGPHPYLFRILDVLYDDDDRSDSDDSDFSNVTPYSDGTVSTLPLYTLVHSSPKSTSRLPAPTFCSFKSQSFTYSTANQWHSDNPDSDSESPVRGRRKTRAERTGRFCIQRDESPLRICSPSPPSQPAQEGLLFAGSFGVVPAPRIEISPAPLDRRLEGLTPNIPKMIDFRSPANIQAGSPGQARKFPLSPLVGVYTTVQLPDNSPPTISRPVSQCPPSQDPIGTPRRTGPIPLLGNQKGCVSPHLTPTPYSSRLSVPQAWTVPHSSALEIINDTTPNGPPSVRASPYDRKYTAELVSDEEEQNAMRNSSGRMYRYSPQRPTRPPGLFTSATDGPTRKEWVPPSVTNDLTGQIGLATQKRVLALLKASKPPLEKATQCPQSPSIPRTPIPQQILPSPTSEFIKSPRPRAPAVGNSWVVQLLEELVEADDESDGENADFHFQSPKTRFARDFSVNDPEIKVYMREDPSPGLDRFLAERRLMSPEPVLALKYLALHDIGTRPCDKDMLELVVQDDSDSSDSDDGMFDDFPVCEMSIAMGLHSKSRRLRNQYI